MDTLAIDGFVRHPEWKRLFDEMKGIVQAGQVWQYSKLSELSGLDIKTTRGRQQFYRFANEVLKTMQLHFENVPRVGYRVVLANEQGRCAHGQLQKARRRIRKGAQIASNTRIGDLTDAQRAAHADLCSKIGTLTQMTRQQGREIRKIAARMEDLKRLPSPMLDAIPVTA